MAKSLTRWNPFAEIERMWPRDIFGGDLWPRLRGDGELGVTWRPRCDVAESDEAITVHAELPGVDPKDIDISVEDARLIIRGEKRTEVKEEKEGRAWSERFFGSFERTLTIPEGVDTAAIEAKAKDGVLEIRIPKPATAKAEPRKITITAS